MRLRPDRTSLHRQSREEARRYDREILGLALPALGALLAEPLFLLTDSAIIGHLGTQQLAGLGVASAVLLNAVFLCIFLAHGTTSAVARLAGAGDLRRAHTQGVDGIWLGLCIGLALAAAGHPPRPLARRPAGGLRRRSSVRRDLPARQPVRPPLHARRARRDGSAARFEGHPHPAARDRARGGRQRAAEPGARLPARAGRGGVRSRDGDRPDRRRHLVVRGRGAGRPPAPGTATTGPSGHRGGGRRERAAVRSHHPPAHRPAGHDLRGCRRGGRRDRQPPDRLHAVVPAGDAAGVVRDRQSGHGRPRVGRLRPGRGASGQSPSPRVGTGQWARHRRSGGGPASGLHTAVHRRPRPSASWCGRWRSSWPRPSRSERCSTSWTGS